MSTFFQLPEREIGTSFCADYVYDSENHSKVPCSKLLPNFNYSNTLKTEWIQDKVIQWYRNIMLNLATLEENRNDLQYWHYHTFAYLTLLDLQSEYISQLWIDSIDLPEFNKNIHFCQWFYLSLCLARTLERLQNDSVVKYWSTFEDLLKSAKAYNANPLSKEYKIDTFPYDTWLLRYNSTYKR